MKHIVAKRYAPWSHITYGPESPPGVISRSALTFDGYEGSHLGCGWYDAEDTFRWTTERATTFLLRHRGQDVLEIELETGPRELGRVRVTIDAGGSGRADSLHTRAWRTLRMRLPALQGEQGIIPITIGVDRTRSAARLGGGDQRELGVAVRAIRLLGTPQSLDLALSSICNPAHWDHPFWRQCLDMMAYRTSFGVVAPEIRHRKMWEWIQGVSGLIRLGCLTPSARALGVAAGHEPVIYWLANRVAQVYATDLYSGRFAGHEATPDVMQDPDKYAPYPYPRERVHFFPMSGSDIAFGDATIDLIFSFCSIEHFGSRENSRRSLQEMARVLRPGGIAAVSTEVLLNDSPPQPEIFAPWELYEELIAPSGLLLIGDIAPANLAPFCADPVDVHNPFVAKPTFVLRDNDLLFTSVMLFLQKAV